MGESAVISFDDMMKSLRNAMKKFPDERTGKNIQYEMLDAAAGAFSMFFTGCPSMLHYQRLLQEKHGMSNARAIFGMHDIPSDTHIRDLLDPVSEDYLAPVFSDCFTALKKSGDLNQYHVSLGKKKNDLLIALDGVAYFSSGDIHCRNCSTKKIAEETVYSHSMVTPTIVAPGVNKVISLMPSFVIPQDGDKKQDCELKASKRWLSWFDRRYLSVTILGDDLYAHEPFCRELLEKGYSFLLVCKPESHKTIYEWVKGVATTVVADRFDGKKHMIYTYQYVEGVPIKDGKDALQVNFLEVTVTDRATGGKLYHNAWITNHPIQRVTIEEAKERLATLVDCGRARWKIENENNNTLKTQGYHLEHNFGHGEKHLATLFATMNILAFLFHTMLEFMDEKYQWLRKAFGARKRLFEAIRILLIYHPYKSFSSFMTFMIEGLQKPVPIEDLHYPL
jgi:hypothetical protein